MLFYTNKKVSPVGKVNKEDLKKWARNALIFLGPALLVLIASTIDAIPADYKYGAIVLYFLNLATSLLKEFLSGNK